MVRLLTVTEFAKRTGFHADTVQAKCRSGEIKAIRFGKRGHYRIAETLLPKEVRTVEFETTTQRRKRVLKARETIK